MTLRGLINVLINLVTNYFFVFVKHSGIYYTTNPICTYTHCYNRYINNLLLGIIFNIYIIHTLTSFVNRIENAKGELHPFHAKLFYFLPVCASWFILTNAPVSIDINADSVMANPGLLTLIV